jgi:hypothetical protein
MITILQIGALSLVVGVFVLLGISRIVPDAMGSILQLGALCLVSVSALRGISRMAPSTIYQCVRVAALLALGGILLLGILVFVPGCAPMVDAVVRLHGVDVAKPCTATTPCLITKAKE